MQKGKIVLLVFGFLAVLWFMPLVGIMLAIIGFNWKFREFFWRLQMAVWIFLTVFLAGLYLTHHMSSFISWLVR